MMPGPMRRFAVILFLLAPATAAGSCGGADLIAELGAAEKARLETLVEAHPYPEGNLWAAEKDGHRVIVAGTLHLPDGRLEPIAETLRPHVRTADVLVLEADAETMREAQSLIATRPELFFLTEGPTLIDLLGDDWPEARARAADAGVPGMLAAKFRPWYLALTLGTPACALDLMRSGEGGLDKALETIAREADVPVVTLDSAETVFGLFLHEPIETQIESLRLALRADGDPEASVSTLLSAYFRGAHREAWEFTRLQSETSGEPHAAETFAVFEEAFLDGRNRLWEPILVDAVNGRDAVVGVGAAHLSGETGVLKALERAGYALRRLD